MPTLQETYDQAARAIYDQGQQALSYGTGYCAYRTESGLKCAAGHLIPDEKYYSELEGNSIYDPESFRDGESGVKCLVCHELGHDQSLVSRLQNAHDRLWTDYVCAMQNNPTDFVEAYQIAWESFKAGDAPADPEDAEVRAVFREQWIKRLAVVANDFNLEPFNG